MDTALITPVIMCGGAGTRLWPLSRESLPKQFAPLVGPTSTFRQVIDRVSDRAVFTRPIIITNSQYRFLVAEELRASHAEAEIVLEPSRRDSAPAIAAAAQLVACRDQQGLLLVVASDHVIRKPEGFVAACQDAAGSAAGEWIVTFGIPPRSAKTSYGYILPGNKLSGSSALEVAVFAEKPDAETAARYMAEGYLWNSGNFLFRADVMLEEIARFEPEIARNVKDAVESATRDLDFIRLADQSFNAAPKKSIDFAVMERTSRAAVIPVEMGWSDVGSWDEVWAIESQDERGNVSTGSVELLDTRNSLIRSDDGILTTVIGCEDMVVITSSDAVLVVPRRHAERVKALVEHLRGKSRPEADAHRRILRPWGYYQGIDLGGRYQVKRIVVEPGRKLSLQKHFHRSEHWVVVKGTAEVTIGTEVRVVHENESMYVPIGSVHRLANPGKIRLELIEVQVGSYLGEDDIVRTEDVYRRT